MKTKSRKVLNIWENCKKVCAPSYIANLLILSRLFVKINEFAKIMIKFYFLKFFQELTKIAS